MLLMLGLVAVVAQTFVWALLCAIVALVLFAKVHGEQHQAALYFSFAESGVWYSSSTDTAPWQISSRSKLTPFALFVHVTEPQSKRHRWYWIWPAEVGDLTYRRLARVIYRQSVR